MKPIYIVSQTTLQRWNRRTPQETGIGGSETAHIEMAEGLWRKGYEVYSYVPLKEGEEEQLIGPTGNALEWLRSESFAKDWAAETRPSILFNYRTPATFDVEKRPGDVFNFVSQDVEYPWTPEQIAKIDRYICLCGVHANYIQARHPELRECGRVFTSTNGICSTRIAAFDGKYRREPHRMFYASSPDRGLQLLLEQWWRVLERFPDARLRIAYGFENCDVIINAMGGNDWRVEFKKNMEGLFKQPGIEWLGRLPQERVWEEWSRAGLFAAPHSFPETSGISFMEAMACGAFPVTNNHWAIVQNVQHGWKQDGIPQNDELLRSIWLHNLYEALEKNGDMGKERVAMQNWARTQFDWNRVVDHFDGWVRKDQA